MQVKGGIRSALASTLLLFSAASLADAIDDYVVAEMSKQQIAGVGLAVIKDGLPIKVQTYGVSNLELNTPVKPVTVFKIGSVSKQFIATAVLLLEDEAKLRLDDRITKYLDGAPREWDAITVSQLLSHTSGLPRESPGFDAAKVQSEADVIKAAYGVALRFQPGVKFEYCNLGYFILAEIIRKAGGTPWPDFVQRRIFEPLGMQSTRLASDTEIISERASGYALVDGRRQHSATLVAIRPSGAFASSIEDLLKWNAALDARRLLKAATWARAWTKAELNDGVKAPYGLGWYIEEMGPYQVVHHGGAIYGFTAQYSRFDEQRLRVIVLANMDAARTDLMALRIAETFLPGVLPRRKPMSLSAEALARFSGKFSYPGIGVATTSVEGAALRWHLPAAGAPVRYIPESTNAFYSEDDPRQLLSFSTGDNGQLIAIITNSGREIARGAKVAADQ